MKKQNQIQVGSLVSHNRFEQGIVTRIRTKTKRKLLKMAQCYVPKIRDEIEQMAYTTVAEVSVTTNGRKSLWTVPLSGLKLIKSDVSRSQFAAAEQMASQIKNAPRERKWKNLDTAYEKGLHNLEPGAAIEVNYRDIGWADAYFVKVNSGGNVTYERNGRQRNANVAHVRVKGAK